MAAKNYTEILALVNAGNQMGLSNTIKRDYGIPLDFTSVQPSYDDAVIYAAENAKAYVGQPLSVGGKLYIINDVAAETKYVVDEKEYDNYLVEVGSSTEGDGATIDLENGVLTLHGFESALTGYLPRKAEDGTLEWVPISAVVQGDGNKVTTITSEDNSVTITKKTDTDESLVYDISVTPYDDTDVKNRLDAVETAIGEEAEGETAATGLYKAIEDAEARAKAYADAQDSDTVYDDTALSNRVKAIEDDYLKAADKYNDAELRGKVTTLETTVGNAESGLVKDLADEVARAKEAERVLGERIDGIDYIDESELTTALEPYAKTADVNTELAKKAAQTDLEALEDKVDAFLTGTGTEAALDSLQELIAYIDEHDGADLTEMIATIEGIEKKLEGVDTTVVAYVTAAIDALKIGDYAKAADLTALAERVTALEAKPFDTYATKTEVQDVDAKFADYTTTTDLNGLLADKADADAVVSNETFNQFKEDNNDAIAAARTGAVADVAAVGYALATDVANTYATKQNLTDHANTMATTLNDYAKAADVETELAKKIESATIDHSTETIPEGVTVNGTELNIVVDAYTKAETLTKIQEKITEINGGESAGEVLGQLNSYKETNDARVGAVETKNTQQDTAIAAAQTQADKGVADAKTANDAIVTINGTLTTHGNDINAVKGRLTTVETASGDHETRIAAAEGDITALKAADQTTNTKIGTIEGNITTLTNKDSELAGLIQANTNKFDDYSTTSQMNTAISEAIAAIPAVDLSDYAKSDDVAKTLEDYAKSADVYTKTEADLAFMTQDEVDARISALIDAANSEDTIKNVNDLVAYVNENAGDIAALITATDANTNKLAGIDTTVTAYVTNAIASVVTPKASTEISVAEDGELGIKEMNVNKLVQTAGDTLIIDGGNAGNTQA